MRHQTSGRVRAHILICELILHLLASLKKRLANAGAVPRTWTTLKMSLRSHAYATLTIKTPTAIQQPRKLGIPDRIRQAIYKQLVINIADFPKNHTILPLS